MARKARLFTIGYEQTPPKAVLDELEQAGVKLLVDVRAVTSSRRPGFSKNQLAAGLDQHQFGGRHARLQQPFAIMGDVGKLLPVEVSQVLFEFFRAGGEIQTRWLETLFERTNAFAAKVPRAAASAPEET